MGDHQAGLLVYPPLLAGLNLHVASTTSLVTGRRADKRWINAVLVAVQWAVRLSTLVLLLRPGRGAAFSAVHTAAFGLSMGGAFPPNHVGMPVVPRQAEVDFIRRRVLMSRNISGGSYSTCSWVG